MSITNDYVNYILDQLEGWGNVQVKRMFGGAALYQDELAFGMIAHNRVYLKVDNTNIDKYLKAGCSQLKPFENNKTVLSFYNIPTEVLENTDEFIEWSKESLEIQKKRNDI
jgi:DNA transformation protein